VLVAAVLSSNVREAKLTTQLDLWRGAFGKNYIARNEATSNMLLPTTRMWAKMLGEHPFSKILEVGSNIGLNLRAIKTLSPAELWAVEPNALARERLVADQVLPADHIKDGFASALPFADGSFDLTFTAGVLIHIHPNDLAASCKEIVRASSRYVLCVEYFSVEPREIPYRGHDAAMFSRDFGKFYLENCPSLRIVDYGVFWTGAGAVDDLMWWLFEKTEQTNA
jgi:pseudaminic acid biosynthesis-associated methylase